MEGVMERMFVPGVLIIGSLFCFYTGLTAFAGPLGFARRLGLEAAGDSGLNEVRAQYGGFFFAAGLLAVVGLAGWVPQAWPLVTMIVIFGGLIAGRLLSLPMDAGSYLPTIRALYFIDGVGAVLSVTALVLRLRLGN
jgi:hypothetical protein